MRPECHHPPFVINVDGDDLPQAALAQLFQRALEHPGDPIVVRGATAYVSPVECSWCRKPFTMVEPIGQPAEPDVTIALAATPNGQWIAWAIAHDGALLWGGRSPRGPLGFAGAVDDALARSEAPPGSTVDVHYDPWTLKAPEAIVGPWDIRLREFPMSRIRREDGSDATLAMRSARTAADAPD